DNAVNYYCIRAIDNTGLESAWTEIMDDSVDKNHYFMAADDVSRIQMPDTSAASLRFEHNNYGADLWIESQEMTTEETGRIVRSMQFNIVNTSNGNLVTDMLFNPPSVRGVIAYTVVGGNVVAGAPEPGSVSSNPLTQNMNLAFNRTPVISASN